MLQLSWKPNTGHRHFISAVYVSSKPYCMSELEVERFSLIESKLNVSGECLAIFLASALAESADSAFHKSF
jgi:hypothetical protein